MASGKGRRSPPPPTRRDSSSRGRASRTGVARSGRLGARDLFELLAREAAPVGWRELVALTESEDASSRKSLRLLVKGLLRSGELMQDHLGHYHPAAGDGRVGVLEGRGRNLTFAGAPVERSRRFRLRPGDRVEATVMDGRARVLRVVEYSSRPVIGELRRHGRYPHVESVSPEYRGRIDLDEPPGIGGDGSIVAVQITGEDRRGLVGVVTAVVSEGGGAAHAAETLLTAHGVPREWPAPVLSAAERLPGQVQPGRHRDRVSLVDVPLVTIDGENARDFDDAVYARPERGGWRLIVAIADVAHYVKPGGALDQCAWERGNSVYLPDRVIPMLPEALSNGLCSLRPHEPRLALVCDMRVTGKGNVTRFEFYEAVIRSWQRLTYQRVQEFLDAHVLDVEAEVQASLSHLEAVYHALRQAREQRGALDFDTHEAVLELSSDGRVSAVHPVARLDAHRLIEEAMIAANVCAARHLERQGRAALYRVHEPPDAEKTEQLRQALAFAGVRLGPGTVTPKLVHDALAELGDRADKWIFEMLALRSMTQAAYSPDNAGHYGLALERYMHFTSPIRRYADLVVHRAIKASLGAGEPGMSEDWLSTTGQHISMTERRAEEVSWGVDGWLKCEYIAGRIGETFQGVVMSVTDFGLFVELSGFYVQGLVHISQLGQDYFRFHAASMTLVGDRSGRRFGLGDELEVRLVEVQPAVGKVDLELIRKAGEAGAGRNGARATAPRTPRRRQRERTG